MIHGRIIFLFFYLCVRLHALNLQFFVSFALWFFVEIIQTCSQFWIIFIFLTFVYFVSYIEELFLERLRRFLHLLLLHLIWISLFLNVSRCDRSCVKWIIFLIYFYHFQITITCLYFYLIIFWFYIILIFIYQLIIFNRLFFILFDYLLLLTLSLFCYLFLEIFAFIENTALGSSMTMILRFYILIVRIL